MADVKMPQLGESVVEGTIGRWLKNVGDSVSKYESLCEVITDKVNAEIPSDFDGVLTEILISEGQTVPVGTVICRIQAPHQAAAEQIQDAPSAAPRFSPAVLQLIDKYRVDASKVTGTGINGRITRKDVLAYVESTSKLSTIQPSLGEQPQVPAQAVSQDEPAHAPAAAQIAESSIAVPQPTQGQGVSNSLEGYPVHADSIIAVSPIRRTIARRMVESKHQIPHAWMMVEVDVSQLVKTREKLKEEFQRKEGVPLTYLPFFIKAIVESIKEYPLLNSTWDEDRISLKKDINISIAVAAGDALYVPVIHKADRQSIAGLAHSISELAYKARNGKLSPHEVQGGTFTVNNTGAFGSIQSMPIINPPQAAILSVESIVKRPVVIEGDAIAVRSMVNLCLSLDHRILDGLVCGRFMASVKNRLETLSAKDVALY